MDRKADPETQLEVDEAILDYLIYTTITSLLKLLDTIDISPRKQHNAHRLAQMVDSKPFDTKPSHLTDCSPTY